MSVYLCFSNVFYVKSWDGHLRTWAELSDGCTVCFSWRFMWRSPERPGGCCDLVGNLRRLSTRRRFHRLELCFPRDHRRASPEQLSPEASTHLLSCDFFKRWGCFVLIRLSTLIMFYTIRFQNMVFHSDAIQNCFGSSKIFLFFFQWSVLKRIFFS